MADRSSPVESIPQVDQNRWEIYYNFEEKIHNGNDTEIKKILEQFTAEDFLAIPIVYDLIQYKKIRLLKLLHQKGIPLNYHESDGCNALHVACGAGGNLECVKFFIDNKISTDIHKKSWTGHTPLTLAISYNHQDILNYFKKEYGINSITLDDLDVILDCVKAIERKFWKRKLKGIN